MEETAKPSRMKQLKSSLPGEISLEDVSNVLSLTIKQDEDNKLITFLCMLSAYTSSSQLNVSFNAPSSSGKTYLATEIAKLFPDEDKIELSGASPTSFYHGEGKYNKTKTAKLVSLERKILLMYEQPNPTLQAKLRAVLSHDQRELKYRITDKDKKGSHRALLIIIRGFPSTIFCSAGLLLDEQEATRAILLSPEVSEEKLKSGVHLQATRTANEAEYESWLKSVPERIGLMERIVAIRDEKIDDIVITEPEEVEKRFSSMFAKLKPRHMRDMGHLMKLIKAIALLNIWYRRDQEGNIVASQKDVDEAFYLWEKVIESQELNVPPTVLNFYKDIILKAYEGKKNNPKYYSDIINGSIGITTEEVSAYYLKEKETTLNNEHLRKQLIPMLVNSSIIAFEQPIHGDKRSKHIYPKWFPKGLEPSKNQNNIGEEGGVDEELVDEIYDLFFSRGQSASK